jgi:hypothetical protein
MPQFHRQLRASVRGHAVEFGHRLDLICTCELLVGIYISLSRLAVFVLAFVHSPVLSYPCLTAGAHSIYTALTYQD